MYLTLLSRFQRQTIQISPDLLRGSLRPWSGLIPVSSKSAREKDVHGPSQGSYPNIRRPPGLEFCAREFDKPQDGERTKSDSRIRLLDDINDQSQILYSCVTTLICLTNYDSDSEDRNLKHALLNISADILTLLTSLASLLVLLIHRRRTACVQYANTLGDLVLRDTDC